MYFVGVAVWDEVLAALHAGAKNGTSFFEFSLCLSRACLGKNDYFYLKMAQKCRFSQGRLAPTTPTSQTRETHSRQIDRGRHETRPACLSPAIYSIASLYYACTVVGVVGRGCSQLLIRVICVCMSMCVSGVVMAAQGASGTAG